MLGSKPYTVFTSAIVVVCLFISHNNNTLINKILSYTESGVHPGQRFNRTGGWSTCSKHKYNCLGRYLVLRKHSIRPPMICDYK